MPMFALTQFKPNTAPRRAWDAACASFSDRRVAAVTLIADLSAGAASALAVRGKASTFETILLGVSGAALAMVLIASGVFIVSLVLAPIWQRNELRKDVIALSAHTPFPAIEIDLPAMVVEAVEESKSFDSARLLDCRITNKEDHTISLSLAPFLTIEQDREITSVQVPECRHSQHMVDILPRMPFNIPAHESLQGRILYDIFPEHVEILGGGSVSYGLAEARATEHNSGANVVFKVSNGYHP